MYCKQKQQDLKGRCSMNKIIIVKTVEVITSEQPLMQNGGRVGGNPTTVGGEPIWEDIAEKNGWRIQRNRLTHHARLIDPKNSRRAWGSSEAMKEALRRWADKPNGLLGIKN